MKTEIQEDEFFWFSNLPLKFQDPVSIMPEENPYVLISLYECESRVKYNDKKKKISCLSCLSDFRGHILRKALPSHCVRKFFKLFFSPEFAWEFSVSFQVGNSRILSGYVSTI